MRLRRALYGRGFPSWWFTQFLNCHKKHELEAARKNQKFLKTSVTKHICLCFGCSRHRTADSPLSCDVQFITWKILISHHCLFVCLETVRTGTMRVIHISVKTEETQILHIKFVLVLSYLNSNTSKSTFPTVDQVKDPDNKQNYRPHRQQVYSSSNRSTFPSLDTRHVGLSCSWRLK